MKVGPIRIKLDSILINVGDLAFRRRVVTILDWLDINNDDYLLDAGCGEGFYLMAISELYPKIKIVGIDFDQKILKLAQNWIGSQKNVIIKKGDINHLPFPNNTFSKIILSEVLEHLQDDLKGLKEIKRVLRPNGIIIITVPNHNYPFWWDPLNKTREFFHLGHFSPENGFFGGIWAKHKRLYYPNEIVNLVKKSGLTIEKIEGLTHYCFPFNHNLLYLGKQFYTRLPVPQSIQHSMEKFQWQKSPSKSLFNPLQWGLKMMSKIDQLNDRKHHQKNLKITSMCLAIKARK